MTATQYARNGDVHLAFQVRGTGTVDLLMPSFGTISIAAFDVEPHLARFLRRLETFARLICYDLRGIGLSDPISPASPPTLEQMNDDAVAVLDRAGSERAFVMATWLGGPSALLMAATRPERVSGLVLANTFARLLRDDDYPFGIPRDFVEAFSSDLTDPDGTSDTADVISTYAPSVASDKRFLDWWEQEGARGASPSTAKTFVAVQAFADMREVLPTITVPVLLFQSAHATWCIPEMGRYLAQELPDVRYVELQTADMPFFTDEADTVLGEVEEFLTGRRSEVEPDRVLTSILFTDIASSTERAAAVGDRAWREVLDRHDDMVRRQIERFGGREIKTMGDGFLATFDGPARAVRCAVAIRDGGKQLGVDVRAGIHTGEVELRGSDVGGINVNLAQRVSGAAGGGEVLVSGTVKDLVFGSGLEFADRGTHELRGVPGAWQLFEVVG